MKNRNKKKSFWERPLLASAVHSKNVKPMEMILGYFIGPFCVLMMTTIVSTYYLTFYRTYSDIVNQGRFLTLLPLISVIPMALSNMFIGILVGKTKTKAGKARPYILVAAPLLLISSIVMFCIPYVNLGFRMVWMAISYNLFAAIANPCYGTSHFLMVSLSTRDLNQRGQLSVVANIPAVAANGFVASILFPILLGWINAAPNNLEIQNRWQIIMIIFAVIAFIGCMLEYKFTRERITEEDMILSLERAEETQKDNILKVSVMEQLKSCMKDKYWWIIMIFYAFYQSGIMFKGGYIMNIFSHQYFSEGVVLFGFQLGADMVQSVLALLSGIPLALGMFFIWPLANKFGKKNMVVIGCVISIIGSVICLTNPDNFMIMLVGQTFKGFSSIPGAYIMMALFADVLDHLEARLGYRVDGISMSVYNTILTVVNGLAIAVFNFFYDNAAFVQAGVSKFFFLEFEIFAHGILLVILLFFNIENNIKEEQALIAERKGIS